MDKEQKLIDIVFDIALAIHNERVFETWTNEQVAEWVAKQLRECGYDTQPIGSSWGVLLQKK